MSNRLVLVDSSVWISHLIGRHHAISQALDDLLTAHRAATNAVVRVEVLTGARDEAQYAELEDAFRGLHVLSLSDAVCGEEWWPTRRESSEATAVRP